jgi:hypothetical protein
MQSARWKTTLCWITVFGIAVGYLESAVVIYLREFYYPSGFTFPLAAMSGKVAFTEVMRELSTLIILLSIAHLAGNNQRQRFAWFLYCFAIWDIFYYVFLKLLINWPESLLTWDVLFLIPTTWTGPVIAPILVSIAMILMTAMMLFIDIRIPLFKTGRLIAVILIIGTGIIFISFIEDYSLFMLKQYFNWWLFLAGLFVVYTGLCSLFLQAMKMTKSI